ncbi:hypothetical protein ASPCADRAFT_203623 [Aspergillus carbonarius ITEM 5010]|uniref:Uncharacterized protein n=1 Tax=Aspergillus carbonarius (strain ITEM 5010) TaxID=602072 RepID=A0A1R3RZ75_ASPC5|nr:hypothetical protein ASPCADRAFT_203623 [Aspergillus carbonarius ITEM 5010]
MVGAVFIIRQPRSGHSSRVHGAMHLDCCGLVAQAALTNKRLGPPTLRSSDTLLLACLRGLIIAAALDYLNFYSLDILIVVTSYSRQSDA